MCQVSRETGGTIDIKERERERGRERGRVKKGDGKEMWGGERERGGVEEKGRRIPLIAFLLNSMKYLPERPTYFSK